MPLYDYRCPVCGARYELLRRIREMDEPATCPEGHAGGIRADVNRVFQKAAPGTYSD
ncbi:MAG TPA: zinc ribbon domain-containing protein, partial [Dehalococcoidia bacterium]|nr:zinc ribbon domain-containing protein [Dehalococcoidia bacterium]